MIITLGDCLITMATGPMSETDADRAGLVSTHAYALLDIRKIQVSLCLCWKQDFREIHSQIFWFITDTI